MRKAEVKYLDKIAGWFIQDEEGYHFLYDQAYLESDSLQASECITTLFVTLCVTSVYLER
jgi:hypothetical protein